MMIGRQQAPRREVCNSGVHLPAAVEHIFCGRIKAVANSAGGKAMGWRVHYNSCPSVINTAKP